MPYLGREDRKTKTHAYVAHAVYVVPVRKNTEWGLRIFVNREYIHSARDVRVRLGLVALPSQVERR